MPDLPGGWLADTLALYGRVFRQGAQLALRNWPVGLAGMGYAVLIAVTTLLVAPLGIVGGFLLGLVLAACGSSFLFLTAAVIRYGRVRLADVPAGFGAYLSDVLTVWFLLWILSWVAGLVLAPFPFLQIVFGLATLAFFNAVPELIYLGRHAPAELLMASYRFVGENWIEWFPANVLLGAVLVVAMATPPGPYGVLRDVVVGLVLAFGAIVRGLLFIELTTSGRRARAFRRASSA